MRREVGRVATAKTGAHPEHIARVNIYAGIIDKDDAFHVAVAERGRSVQPELLAFPHSHVRQVL